MQINRIDDMNQFDALREAWDAAYVADPQATFFVSWVWLRGWFDATPDNWFVLALRPDTGSPYVAFFPLAMHSNQLLMGGNYLADYTGFVCSPEYEEEAIPAFATFVQKELKWDSFGMHDVLDSRLGVFLECFPSKKFNVQQAKITSCPYIRLPGNWDQYLQDFLGRRTRADVRSSLRKIEASDEFHFTHVGADNLENQVETLLSHWYSRWELPEHFQNGLRKIFYRCFENDCLWLSILWYGIRPIGMLSGFIDRQKKTFTACITSSDKSDKRYARIGPGKAVCVYSIRYAIENGCNIYDFTRGKEDYKLYLGSIERFAYNVSITRKSLRLTVRKLRRKIFPSRLRQWVSSIKK